MMRLGIEGKTENSLFMLKFGKTVSESSWHRKHTEKGHLLIGEGITFLIYLPKEENLGVK
jgi:hypothetical protein